MPLFLLALAFGCFALYVGGDRLVLGMKGVGRILSLSPAVVGLLLVSFGTSAPELFVSAGAALQGFGGIAAGNAIGSNIANLAIALGAGALITALPIGDAIARRQIPVMCVVTMLALGLMLDDKVTRLDGLLLLGVCFAGLSWASRTQEPPAAVEANNDAMPDSTSDGRGVTSHRTAVLQAIVGIALLMVGAEALIWSGSGIAAWFGLPEAVIALTITAVGTSLPEITATLIAVRRRDVDLAIGNIIGSNIMNIGFVLGLAGVLTPIDGQGIGLLTWVWLLGLSGLVALLACWPGRVTRLVGGALLGSYVLYVVLLLR